MEARVFRKFIVYFTGEGLGKIPLSRGPERLEFAKPLHEIDCLLHQWNTEEVFPGKIAVAHNNI